MSWASCEGDVHWRASLRTYKTSCPTRTATMSTVTGTALQTSYPWVTCTVSALIHWTLLQSHPPQSLWGQSTETHPPLPSQQLHIRHKREPARRRSLRTCAAQEIRRALCSIWNAEDMWRHSGLPWAQPSSYSDAADCQCILQTVCCPSASVLLCYTMLKISEADAFCYYFCRPGDYLQAEDDEIDGFKHRLNERLAPVGSQFSGDAVNDEWQIGDTLAQWWRPNFETFMYPFLPAHVTRPKECKKLYFIQLPKSSMPIPILFCGKLNAN